MIELKQYCQRLWIEYSITWNEETKQEAIQADKYIELKELERYLYVCNVSSRSQSK